MKTPITLVCASIMTLSVIALLASSNRHSSTDTITQPTTNELSDVTLIDDAVVVSQKTEPTYEVKHQENIIEHVSSIEKADSESPSQFDVSPIEDPNTESSDRLAVMATRLDDLFRQESYDSKWAPDMENQTWEELYSKDLDKSDVEYIECRTTLCRILINHQDESAQANFQATLIANINGRRGFFRHIEDESGNLSTLLFRYR